MKKEMENIDIREALIVGLRMPSEDVRKKIFEAASIILEKREHQILEKQKKRDFVVSKIEKGYGQIFFTVRKLFSFVVFKPAFQLVSLLLLVSLFLVVKEQAGTKKLITIEEHLIQLENRDYSEILNDLKEQENREVSDAEQNGNS